MNTTLHPVIAQAINPFIPQQQITTNELNTAIRRWSRSKPLHNDISSVFAVLAAAVKQNGAMTDKCKSSVIDQLDELANEVDQDFVNQRDEA